MKVLVADDSKAMRMIVVRTLRQAGLKDLTVIEAENGKIALDLAGSESPDLILSDWNMPEMTGIQFLRALRATGSTTPFCFVTSEGSDDMVAQAEQAGAMGVITKPFTADAFADKLQAVMA